MGMASLYNKNVEERYPRMGTYLEDDDEMPGQRLHKYWILTEEKNLKLKPEKQNKCQQLLFPV